MRTALPANRKTRPNVVSMLVQRNAGGGLILKQHWVKCSRLLGSTQVFVYTNPSATILFSPADQGTFSKTAGQSQAYYNTWNLERGTYDVNHLHILTCEGAVSRVSSVPAAHPQYSQVWKCPPPPGYIYYCVMFILNSSMSLSCVVESWRQRFETSECQMAETADRSGSTGTHPVWLQHPW